MIRNKNVLLERAFDVRLEPGTTEKYRLISQQVALCPANDKWYRAARITHQVLGRLNCTSCFIVARETDV